MSQNRVGPNLNVLITYWSTTKNTEKVAFAIKEALIREGLEPVIKKINEASDEELFDYDLVFLGTPSHMWQPPAPVQKYIKEKMEYFRNHGDIKLCAPKIPGKKAVVFVTYSGPHTGIDEAIPVGKYCNQFFEHLGFELVGEWYIVGEFHGSEENSTKGRLGDIRGRPNQQDLDEVKNKVSTLIKSILLKS